MMKNNIPLYIGIGLFILVLIVGGIFLLAHTQQTAFTTTANCQNVYCNDYEFICCGEQDSAFTSTLIGGQVTYCSGAMGCTINSNSAPSFGLMFGKTNCKESSFLGIKHFSCSDDTQIYNYPASVPTGYEIHISSSVNYVNGADASTTLSGISKNQVLRWTGAAADYFAGIKVQGADGCTFVTDKNVYDTSGSLKQTPSGSQISVTVPAQSCYLSASSRHVCGDTCESCNSDTDCAAGHTLIYNNKGAECHTGQVDLYGCRNYGAAPTNNEINVLPGTAQNTVKLGTRCEVKSSITVQCCPNTNDCGNNAACDPITFTCKQNVQCTADWNCGTAQTCDRTAKIIKQPACVSGQCGFKTISTVGCCLDQDCASGYYCGTDNQCKQRNNPKVDCPFDCCSKETSYFDKPCANGLFCTDRKCVPTPPDTCGAWITMPAILGGAVILPNLWCIFVNWVKPIITIGLWVLGIIFGLIILILLVILIKAIISKPGRKNGKRKR